MQFESGARFFRRARMETAKSMKNLVLLILIAFVSVCKAEGLNVFMTGDSHIGSKIYPETVGDILEEADPEIVFSWWGKNGARFDSFNSSPEMMGKIYAAKPDILIVHLGTNDSYTKNFDEKRMMKNLTTFYHNVKSRFPECRLVLVTPFYNRLKDHSVNDNAGICADVYLEFAETHPHVYVVDNNADFGMYFLDGGNTLIRNDGVHLTTTGYERLGEQVGAAVVEMVELWDDVIDE